MPYLLGIRASKSYESKNIGGQNQDVSCVKAQKRRKEENAKKNLTGRYWKPFRSNYFFLHYLCFIGTWYNLVYPWKEEKKKRKI